MKEFDLKKYLIENKLLNEETETYKPGRYRVLEFDTDRYSSYGDFLELTREATLEEILEILNQVVIALSLVLVFQITIISREKLLEETIIMRQN